MKLKNLNYSPHHISHTVQSFRVWFTILYL